MSSITASSPSSRDGASDRPPPYHLSRVFPCPCENTWKNYPGLRRYRPKDGPDGKISIHYRSNPCALTTDCAWAARVLIKTKDMARLMHRGIFLTQEHVDFRKNHCRVLTQHEHVHWTHARHFEAENKKAHWTASVTVYALDLGTLGAFRLQDLCEDTVHSASAQDGKSRPLYWFSLMRPENNFNAIFDDLPLPGMWPWPKAPGEQDAGGGNRRDKKKWSLRGALGLKKSRG